MAGHISAAQSPKYSRHKIPKVKAVLQLIRDFVLSTFSLGMPSPYLKSSHKSMIVFARNTKRKLKFHDFEHF